jgi:hypothetical protein
MQREIVLHFAHGRTTDGADIGATLRENLPDGDIRAVLDDNGAVSGYVVTLTFDDTDQALEAAFRLCDYLTGEGIGYEVEDVHV